ncbi:hypothetical protein [Rhizobium sp. P44RR-XXIV]|uniref:hypothetical protein n=1 Tax=Rhizobium sp. P44RR-XXIV TaxID=1921145 RepID=UPI0010A9A72D|nr:hypothetical protein [Rhizobium sp. P44RR-XXIV]TIX88910.1 hypothetical protein BSK43_019905 [Rhizobium sp. P44RR-XXIV]
MFLILLSMEIDSSHIGPNDAHENSKAAFHDRKNHVLNPPAGVPFLTRCPYILEDEFSTA